MYLKEIKAYGFKSFADKINIELDKDINGIVGPNGSGKSNIVDAVRWVLGEQSIKSLRGETSSDIIFSGSKNRKPLSSAFVTLVFDNKDHHLPLDFDEVSIKRVAFRNGDNEYYINNEKCRLKDISTLFTDSGAAKESFNIISQGKIDEILSTKAADRRVIFEEAAGVLKYKKRKDEAIRKLERTNDNIMRINDIISELETTVNPLKEQRDKAIKYNEIKSKLEEIEIALITEDVDSLNYEYKELSTNIDNLSDEISFLRTNTSVNDTTSEKTKIRLKEIDNSIYEKQSSLLKYTKNKEEIDSKIKLLDERSKYNKDNIFNTNITDIKNNIYNLESRINDIESQIEVNNKIIIDNNNKTSKNKEEYNKYIDIKNKKELFYSTNNRTLNDYMNKINNLEEDINNGSLLPYSVKSILDNPKYPNVHNIIGNLIDIDSKYSLAISTALGSMSSYLVVDTSSVAKSLVNYLKENNLGRATFYPIDVIKPRIIDDDIIYSLKNIDGFIDIASNLVKYDTKYNNIISNVLGNIIVVDSIDNANYISKYINNKYKVVTLDGQVINVGGSITGGSKIKTKNVISMKYEKENLERMLSKLQEDNKKIDKEIKDIYNKTTELENINKNLSEIARDKYNDNKYLDEKKNELKRKLLDYENELKDIEIISGNNEDDEKSKLLKEFYNIKDLIINIEKEINILKLDKEKLEKDNNDILELIKYNNSNISKKEKELSNMEIRKGKIDVKLDNLLMILNNDYNITFEIAKSKYKLEIDKDIARDEVREYKDIIKALGIVNPLAIEEYEKVSERYNFLNSQKEDLTHAEDTLLEIINEMDSIMKDKFLDTYNKINIEFKKIFRELFKGGNANLTLTNPEDLLETGIEIFAEPPGKKLQSISLLSGGEKTFTAISLLFAILNVRPVPFCILDEVEAALDDANVISFGNYLSKYKDKTQFILITHKKKTMEFVNVLYGITMQEAGISKLVSVKLEEREKVINNG